MFKKKVIYIGKKVLEPGNHFVLVDGFLETKGYISREIDVQGGEQCQLFVPLGYTIKKYCTPDRGFNGTTYYDRASCEGSISYVNIVPVEVKVYEKDGKQFSPEFGTPIKGKRR